MEATLTAPQASTIRVDFENKVIRGARLVGLRSANGVEYPIEVLRRAMPRYEGVPIHIEHDRKNLGRRFGDRIGFVRHVTSDEGGLRGDLFLMKTHPATDRILEQAQRTPKTFGVSHDCIADVASLGGKRVCREIVRVRGLDFVERPAATRNLFEADGRSDGATFDLRGVMRSARCVLLREAFLDRRSPTSPRGKSPSVLLIESANQRLTGR